MKEKTGLDLFFSICSFYTAGDNASVMVRSRRNWIIADHFASKDVCTFMAFVNISAGLKMTFCTFSVVCLLACQTGNERRLSLWPEQTKAAEEDISWQTHWFPFWWVPRFIRRISSPHHYLPRQTSFTAVIVCKRSWSSSMELKQAMNGIS